DDPAAVEALLGSLAGLSPLLARGQELAHRVEARTADQERFVRAVAEIADGLGEGIEPDAALVAARGLRSRLDAARMVETQAERLAADLEALGDRRAAIAVQLRSLESRLEAMTRFFGVETPEAVRSALDLCQRRDQIAAESAELSRRIAAEMEAPSLAEALAKMEGADGEVLEAELAELSPRVEGLEAQVRARVAERAIAEDRLAAIGGDDAVARIEGRRRTLVLEMEDLALRYLRLRSGALLAEQALRAYRERHRSAMMNRASEAFRAMTRGAYAGLATRPEKEREALIGLVEGGGSKLAVDMSKGTRFQLYLALRLAGYEEFATARPPVPFIADDIMETFDEPRSEEVFRLLGRMAGMGQVIYLTHHRHLCTIARAVVPGVTLHEIDTGA
ncbi:MAG: ATP-binding protein, partial [Devosia sp.]